MARQGDAGVVCERWLCLVAGAASASYMNVRGERRRFWRVGEARGGCSMEGVRFGARVGDSARGPAGEGELDRVGLVGCGVPVAAK